MHKYTHIYIYVYTHKRDSLKVNIVDRKWRFSPSSLGHVAEMFRVAFRIFGNMKPRN